MSKKPTMSELLPLLRAFAVKPCNSEGGSLHTLLSDGNTHTSGVLWSIEHAKSCQDADAIVIAEIMLQMSRTQRGKARREFARMVYLEGCK